MADSAISFRTPRGEVKIATDLVNDPQFGPVHLFRVVGGGSGPSGEVDVSDRAARLVGHVTVDNYAQFPGGAGGGSGMSLAEFQSTLPLPVAESAFPVDFAVNNFPANFGSVQSGVWSVGVNNFPASQAVTGPLTDTQLRAAAVPVSGPLTDTQLRAAAVPVSGTFWQATQPVSGTFWQATQPVSGPLTDTQLRASAVPVSGPLTDTQLRASAVPVSMSSGGAYTVTGVSNAAPAANAVQADTGALPAGTYDFIIVLCASDTVAVGKGMLVEHRNAANSATNAILGAVDAPNAVTIETRLTLALNERVRVIMTAVAGAASSRYTSSIHRRLG